MNRRPDERYKHYYQHYVGETLPDAQKKPSEKAMREGELRRRIEDVREGLRLDEEAFGEVWE